MTQIPLFAALAYIVVAHPGVFRWTHRYIAGPLGLSYIDASGKPTPIGLVVHALVMFLLVTLFLRSYDVGGTFSSI